MKKPKADEGKRKKRITRAHVPMVLTRPAVPAAASAKHRPVKEHEHVKHREDVKHHEDVRHATGAKDGSEKDRGRKSSGKSGESRPKVTAKPVAKRRAWSPDSDVGCCSARAVAEALRIVSGPVLSDRDVLTLHGQAGGSESAGASILATLEVASQRFSLGLHEPGSQVFSAGGGPFADRHGIPAGCDPMWQSARGALPGTESFPHALILGLDLPWGEPHAVTVDLDGTWWSWGEPYGPADFPGAVIEEAWAVWAGAE